MARYTLAELIDRCGGIQAVADQTGASWHTVHAWYYRRRFPRRAAWRSLLLYMARIDPADVEWGPRESDTGGKLSESDATD